MKLPTLQARTIFLKSISYLLIYYLISAICCPVIAASLEEGIGAFERGNYLNARRILKAKDLKDDPMACIYLQAMGEDQRPRGMEGFWEFVRIESAKGNRVAKLANAQRRLRHTIDSKDHSDGVERFLKMVDEGFAPAAFFLGLHYEEGVRLHKDYGAAFTLYEKAESVPMAQYRRAKIILDKLVPGHSQSEGINLLRYAAELGSAEAQFKLAVAYHSGTLGFPQNKEESYTWCERSAKQSYPHALYSLGRHYAHIEGALDKTISYYRQAGQVGEPRAWRMLEDYMRTRMIGKPLPYSDEVALLLPQKEIDLSLRSEVLNTFIAIRDGALNPSLRTVFKSFQRGNHVPTPLKLRLAQTLLQHPQTDVSELQELLMDPNIKEEGIKHTFVEQLRYFVTHHEVEKAKDYVLAVCGSAWDKEVIFGDDILLRLFNDEHLDLENQYQLAAALMGKYEETIRTQETLRDKIDHIIRSVEDPVLLLTEELQLPARNFVAAVEAIDLTTLGLLIVRQLTMFPEEIDPATRRPKANQKAILFLNNFLTIANDRTIPPAEKEAKIYTIFKALQYSLKPAVIPVPTQVPEEVQINEAFFNDSRITLANQIAFADKGAVDERAYTSAVDSLVGHYTRLVAAGKITDQMRFDGDWAPAGSRDRTGEVVSLLEQLKVLFIDRGDILTNPAYDPRDSDHARWLYFWSDEYKPHRPAFWIEHMVEDGIVTYFTREQEYLGNGETLRRLLEHVGSNPNRYKKKIVAIAPYLETSDDDILAVKLSALGAAGRHCSTRAEDETNKMYQEFKPSIVGEESLENYVSKLLAQVRREILESFIVRSATHEPSHQIAYLMKRMHPSLGLYGDDDQFEDQYGFVVQTRLRDPATAGYVTDGALLAFVKERYTPERIIDKLYTKLTEPGEEARKLYNKVLQQIEECKSRKLRSLEGLPSTEMADLYDEDMINFTKEAAKAILYGLGYLEKKLAEVA